MKNIRNALANIFQNGLLSVIIIVSVIAIGFLMLRITRAITAPIPLEPENASVTSPAAVGDDTTASGNKYVRFNGSLSTSFAFTAAGDHGLTADSRASMQKVGTTGSAFYLALGDLSYAAGMEDEWCATFKGYIKDVEVLAGNHDVGESSGGDINRYRQFCPFTLGTLVGDYGKQYYFDYPQTSKPLARFIMIAPGVQGSLGINYKQGGAGYIFTSDAIDKARAAGVKWLVIGMHKNCISVGRKSCEVGTDLMNLLISKKVDLILQSHDHNYQRSHALSCLRVNSFSASCIGDSGSDGVYNKGSGPVVIINGEFGRGFYAVKSDDSEAGFFAKTDSTTFGVTKYTISDTQMTAQYIGAKGSFADSFTIK